MPKALVVVVLCSSMLFGCSTAEERETVRLEKRAAQLASFRLKCSDDYGYKNNTEAMSKCIQNEDNEAARKQQETARYNIEYATAGFCRLEGNSYNKLTGECTPPPEKPSGTGTIFNNSNKKVGTFSY